MAANPKHHQNLSLPDGRSLGFAEFGALEGPAIFYFHGFPGSRLEARLVQATASRLGLRVIAVDRPGFGISHHQTGRRLTDWPADIRALARHLKTERFSVLGVSGGGPYAMVCAQLLEDQVESLTLVGALGPIHQHSFSEGMRGLDRTVLSVCRLSHQAGRPLMRLASWAVHHHTERLLNHLAGSCPPKDRKALGETVFRQNLASSFREAFRGGSRGSSLDLHLLARPWGFEPGRIRVPATLFHGQADTIVPCRHGRLLSEIIPGCRVRFIQEEGHYSLVANHLEEILASSRPLESQPAAGVDRNA